MIVTEDEQVMALLDAYADTGDREELERNILILLKSQPRIKPPSPVSIPRREIAPAPEEEETSSPLGTFLHERKKHQHGEMQLQLNLCQPVPGAQEDVTEMPGLVNSS